MSSLGMNSEHTVRKVSRYSSNIVERAFGHIYVALVVSSSDGILKPRQVMKSRHGKKAERTDK